jgi:hypothetical protein
MNTAVTLTAEEFTRIHNALCFAPNQGLEATVDAIREALAGAYRQEEQDFDRKMAYYTRFKAENKLKAVWSMYEIEEHGFLKDHPYTSDAFVCYQGQRVPVSGSTWGDIYRAADAAIQASGDTHHCFIESFTAVGDRPGHLRLGTGS